MAVVDASVLVAFYASDDPRRAKVAARLALGDALHAPAHLDAEVLSALRGLAGSNTALRATVPGALRHLAGFAIRRQPLAPLLQRVWELRDDVTAYDAAYVTLAPHHGSAPAPARDIGARTTEFSADSTSDPQNLVQRMRVLRRSCRKSAPV